MPKEISANKMIDTNKNDDNDELELLLTVENAENPHKSTANVGKFKVKQNFHKLLCICGKTADNNFSVSEIIYEFIKKKQIIVFIILILIVFYINLTANPWYATEKIPVVHHFYAPEKGMKELDKKLTAINNHTVINAKDNAFNDNISTIPTEYTTLNTTNTRKLPILESSNPHTTASISTTTITFSNYDNTSANVNLATILPNIPAEFLVWSDKCRMPNIDPYDPKVMKYFKRQRYESCSTEEPLTNIQFNSTTKQYTLKINEDLKLNYGKKLDCCYQDIIRNKTGNKADKEIKLSECFSFKNSVQLSNTTDNILVKCKSHKNQVYIHGHPMMPERADIRARLDTWNNNESKRAPSILMIGIDSISRINLIRAMPKTAQKLYDNEWFEMRGYNKIDDNTFPNLMAILTGFNLTTAFNICNPKKLHTLDNCPIIWKLFRDHGYVTAYAEDEVPISTFNYLKIGFEVPPVDYYLRPFMIAAEKYLPIRKKSGLKFCLGNQHSADYIFDYAIELATRYKNEPLFGLFWANTFSHNSISDCSSMDSKVAEYLEKLSSSGILNENIVIFFSDHGMRFGEARKTLSGYFEERLPFMFIWLPEWFKTKYPKFLEGLNINQNRLTNPYDIYMTLKNLLELSGRISVDIPKAKDCPNCQSLLTPVPYNRSCEDIAIVDHWCTCIPYKSIETKSVLVHQLALFVVNYINEYLKNFNNGTFANLCGTLQLHNIGEAYQADSYPKKLEEYRLVITTTPGNALFEVTLRRKTDTGELEVTGTISRLNSYDSDSKCVSNSNVKKYCHCSANVTKTKITTKIKTVT